jgi:hypothetical protein
MEIMDDKSKSNTEKVNKSNEGLIIPFLIRNIRSLVVLIIVCGILIIWLLTGVLQTRTFSEIFLSGEMDPFGALLGIASILIGLITVAYVERNNETRMEDNDKILNQIHGKLHLLEVLDDTQQRFAAIEQVLTASKEPSNELYMLSYGVKYGQFLLTNLNVINDNNKLDFLEPPVAPIKHLFKRSKNLDGPESINASMIYESAAELHKVSQSISQQITQLAKQNKLNIGCLKREKYKHFVRSRILKDKTVILATDHQPINITDKCSSQNGDKVCIGPSKGWKDVFIYNMEPEGATNEERIEKLITAITNKDFDIRRGIRQHLSKYSSNTKVPVGRNTSSDQFHELDYVPFQFFLCAPLEGEEVNEKVSGWNAVIVYTDYYNIGKKNSVVTFRTNNRSFCMSLKETFQELAHSTGAKNQNNAFLKRCFHSSDQINFVNNIMLTEDGSGNPVSVIAKDDIFAKEYLEDLYKNLDLEFKSDSIYININEPITEKDIFFKASSFSIGLFHNSLSTLISGSFPRNKDKLNKNFSLFKLIEKGSYEPKLDNEGVPIPNVNIVEILCQNEVYTIKDVASDKFTYSILTKCLIDNKWTFVYGGLDAVGTSKIKPCIDEFKHQMVTGHELDHYNITETTPFIVVFKIQKVLEDANKSPVSIEKLTILEDGKLRTTSFNAKVNIESPITPTNHTQHVVK